MEAPVWVARVARRFVCGFRTDLHFADEGEPANTAITLDCILHDNSMLAAPQLAGTACSYSSFCSQIKPHETFISFFCTALNPYMYV